MAIPSDTEKAPRSRLAVPADEFVRFLEEKTQGLKCPSCAADDWTVVCPTDDYADTYRLVTTLRDGSRPMNLSTFAIYCDNCGFVRQHLSRVVRAWVEQNPAAPELDFQPPLDLDEPK
ncbi:hypothetical protein D3C77_348660 [compost metagenome]